MIGRVWFPAPGSVPGRLGDVDLGSLRIGERELEWPGLRVVDVRSIPLFIGSGLSFEPRNGGGPMASEQDEREARAFGVVNVGYHLWRGLDRIAELLGRPLPPLVAKIGMHESQNPSWGGGHYRLPSEAYSELPEMEPVSSSGEIHLGCGNRYLRAGSELYFHAPSHNAAIIYHELGHHLCRHTADFRLNERRPPQEQANRKIPLDEGTSDYLAAILLGKPDIFEWQRWDIPRNLQARRHLDAPWTMRQYVGSARNDPHLDGTVWSSALWAARQACVERGIEADLVDRLVLRSLEWIGRASADADWNDVLRERRHFSHALTALLETDRAYGAECGDIVAHVLAQRGIVAGLGNRELRQRARTRRDRETA